MWEWLLGEFKKWLPARPLERRPKNESLGRGPCNLILPLRDVRVLEKLPTS